MRTLSTRVTVLGLTVAATLATGPLRADDPLAPLIIGTPYQLVPIGSDKNPFPPLEKVAGADQSFRVRVGPPEATLSVSIIEPPERRRPPKGTVLVIHGIYARSFWMMPHARRLAKAGYRAVLVDLRGHGRSSGEMLGYGPREARDVAQVIDSLGRRGLVAGKIGVFGISYGATTSIHLAAVDPRVRAVVAVAPFNTMREAVPQFGRAMVPIVGKAISEEAYQRAIDEAGRLGGFDPDASSAAEAIKRTQAQVLLLHGTHDRVVPARNSRAIHAAAPDHSRLAMLPLLGHTTIWADPRSEVTGRAWAWFDRWLIGADAPPAPMPPN
jgi:pimeloyl-ACP methyl ester carboxylesterase